MTLHAINFCPSTLAEGFSTYSRTALNSVFYGKKVNHILDFNPPDVDEEVAEKFRENSLILSISGAQYKQSLILEKNKLRLSREGEHGQYILKPIPIRAPFKNSAELPANEHLTMQIAKQIYGLHTAECALIFFKNGEPAYITKRFDVGDNGVKIAQEDFASLSGKSKEKDGRAYKTQGSYESLAAVMKKYVSAYAVEVEKYFSQILFNYLFCNEDAHLKNFSLRQTGSGDYILSPVYDLTNTLMHIPNDKFFALDKGLFEDEYQSDDFNSLGYYSYSDFFLFGKRIGMSESQIRRLLDIYCTVFPDTNTLIEKSFLTAGAKTKYTEFHIQRLKMLRKTLPL